MRVRSEEWLQYVSNDRRLGLTAVVPADPFPATRSPVRAMVYFRR